MTQDTNRTDTNPMHVCKVTFIEKPKGLRFNSFMSRDIREKGIEYVSVSVTKKAVVIRPAIPSEGDRSSFKVLFSGEVAQVASAAVYRTAEKRNLLGKKTEGVWNGRKLAYEFDVTKTIGNGNDDTLDVQDAEYASENEPLGEKLEREALDDQVRPQVRILAAHNFSQTPKTEIHGEDDESDGVVPVVEVLIDEADPVESSPTQDC